MSKGSAEDVLKVIEELRKEANVKRVIEVDECGWEVQILHKCYDQFERVEFWRLVASKSSETFIEVLDFAVGQGDGDGDL